MDREFIPYELALELKQLGFDEPCLKFYTEGILWLDSHLWDIKKDVLAPTYSQAFRWFREKHQLNSSINTTYTCYTVSYVESLSRHYGGSIDNRGTFTNVGFYETYEEAEKKCLIKLIEIVKNGK